MFTGGLWPQPWPKLLVTQMLTRDLFAVANLLSLAVSDFYETLTQPVEIGQIYFHRSLRTVSNIEQTGRNKKSVKL